VRRVLFGIAATVAALGAVLLVLLFVSGRDQGGVSESGESDVGQTFPRQGSAHHAPPPGFRYSSSPPTSGPHRVVKIPGDGHRLSRDQLLSALELGNVVLLHPPGPVPPALLGVQRAEANGPTTVARSREGSAVIIGTFPGTGAKIVALSCGRMLRAASPRDPRIDTFASRYLQDPACG
jgi:hypothetical protein